MLTADKRQTQLNAHNQRAQEMGHVHTEEKLSRFDPQATDNLGPGRSQVMEGKPCPGL